MGEDATTMKIAPLFGEVHPSDTLHGAQFPLFLGVPVQRTNKFVQQNILVRNGHFVCKEPQMVVAFHFLDFLNAMQHLLLYKIHSLKGVAQGMGWARITWAKSTWTCRVKPFAEEAHQLILPSPNVLTFSVSPECPEMKYKNCSITWSI